MRSTRSKKETAVSVSCIPTAESSVRHSLCPGIQISIGDAVTLGKSQEHGYVSGISLSSDYGRWQSADARLLAYPVEAPLENPLPGQTHPTIRTGVVKAAMTHKEESLKLNRAAPARGFTGRAHMPSPPPRLLTGNFHRLPTFPRTKSSPPLLAPVP